MFEPHAATMGPRGVGRWSAVIACTLLVLGAFAFASAAHAAPRFTPMSASVVAAPQLVRGTDGRLHVVYEILLQNTAELRLDVQSLAVRARGGRTLLTVAGPAIPTVMTTVSGQPVSSLASGEGARVWVDLSLRRASQVPRALVHRLRVGAVLPSGEALTVSFDVARTRVNRRRAASLSPPLRGGPYLNFNGCCGLSPHRLALAQVDGVGYLSERFASDFIRIDDQGRGGEGDLTRNESFFTFGEPVHAVASGRVVRTLNNVPENVPLNEPPGDQFTTRTIVGNQVVLKLRDGRFAAYGHLQRGSVSVRRGERVRRGQVIGRVGNSGQSGGAHLHFQLSNGPDPISSEGIPYVFRRFSLVGIVTNVEEFLTGAANAQVVPRSPASPRRKQLPLHATVVRFPD
jgi:peptidase M23-like protein